MKTLVVAAPGKAVYTDEYSRPEATGDQVVVKVLRNGICATDMAILEGTAGFIKDGSTPYPVRFGHEFVGKVVECGSDVKHLKPGDRVISEGFVSCGTCEACKKGHYERCQNMRSVGTVNTWPGSYAEYCLFPERHLIKIPESFSNDLAALIEPAAVGMLGVKKCAIVPDETTVLVIGVGPIGIAAAALAKHYGAKKVMISGRTPWKLEIAKKLGVDAVCNPTEESLRDFVMRETDGKGVDSIIECSGNISVLDDAIDVLTTFGKLVVVAFYEKLYSTFDLDKLTMKEGSILTVVYHDYEDVIRAMEEGLDLTPLITRHIPFGQCGPYMERCLTEKKKDYIKLMVDFD